MKLCVYGVKVGTKWLCYDADYGWGGYGEQAYPYDEFYLGDFKDTGLWLVSSAKVVTRKAEEYQGAFVTFSTEEVSKL